MEIRQVKETCLYIQDLDRAKDFYNGILGFPIISKVNNRHIFFRAGSSVLLCFNPDVTKNEDKLPPHFAFGKQHIAFEVDQADYSGWLEKILSKGIIITHEQEWKDGLKSFYFEDPDGHVLEIIPNGIWE
jgi:catechol 2,3-dioxygenase-like lactoylglutathione lyase family enzyme